MFWPANVWFTCAGFAPDASIKDNFIAQPELKKPGSGVRCNDLPGCISSTPQYQAVAFSVCVVSIGHNLSTEVTAIITNAEAASLMLAFNGINLYRVYGNQ